MRALLLTVVQLGLPGSAAAWDAVDPYEIEPTPCRDLPEEGPEFLPADGTTDVPTNLRAAFARWPELDCDFEVRLFVEGQADAISVDTYWFQETYGHDAHAWQTVELPLDAGPGTRFRIEVHPSVGERRGFQPYIAHFQVGQEAMTPPDPISADVSGSAIERTGKNSRGLIVFEASWPEVAGTPYGYAELWGVGVSEYRDPSPILLADQDGNFTYRDGIRLPALREACYSASLRSNLTPADRDWPSFDGHQFCLRRAGCSALPSSGLAPMLLALVVLLARRRGFWGTDVR